MTRGRWTMEMKLVTKVMSCHELTSEWAHWTCADTAGGLPKDEVSNLDPELYKLWLEARDRHLGHLSAYNFDVASAPSGAPSRQQSEASMWYVLHYYIYTVYSIYIYIQTGVFIWWYAWYADMLWYMIIYIYISL